MCVCFVSNSPFSPSSTLFFALTLKWVPLVGIAFQEPETLLPDDDDTSVYTKNKKLKIIYLATLRPRKKRAMSWSDDCQGKPRARTTVLLSTSSSFELPSRTNEIEKKNSPKNQDKSSKCFYLDKRQNKQQQKSKKTRRTQNVHLVICCQSKHYFIDLSRSSTQTYQMPGSNRRLIVSGFSNVWPNV